MHIVHADKVRHIPLALAWRKLLCYFHPMLLLTRLSSSCYIAVLGYRVFHKHVWIGFNLLTGTWPRVFWKWSVPNMWAQISHQTAAEAPSLVQPNYTRHLHQSTPVPPDRLITSQMIFLPRIWAHEVSPTPIIITQPALLLQWRAAEADSCIKQCHPLSAKPIWARSLVTTDNWRLGVCWGNNNLKGPLLLLLLLFCLLLCSLSLSLSVSPSLSPSLLGFISGPGQCPTVMSWCDLCHWLWSWLISLLSQFSPQLSSSSTFPPHLHHPTEHWLPQSQPAWLLQ